MTGPKLGHMDFGTLKLAIAAVRECWSTDVDTNAGVVIAAAEAHLATLPEPKIDPPAFPASDAGYIVNFLRQGIQPYPEEWYEARKSFPDEVSARTFLASTEAAGIRCVEIVSRRTPFARDPVSSVVVKEAA